MPLWFGQTLERFRPRHYTVETPRAPEGQTIYAIGDVHGRFDLLQRLLRQIEEDLEDEEGAAEIIFLGDYVDRGPDARRVLELLVELKARAEGGVSTLRGNHEAALVDFLLNPAAGPAWAQHGGLQTLESYGVAMPSAPTAEDFARARDAFAAVLPPDHFAFLQDLELWTQRGDYVFVHAGVRPGVPMEAQEPRDLMWIRGGFLDHDTQLAQVVIHGHTVDQDPAITPFRIGVDTGAYATGVLTALRLKGAERRFLQTRG